MVFFCKCRDGAKKNETKGTKKWKKEAEASWQMWIKINMVQQVLNSSQKNKQITVGVASRTEIKVGIRLFGGVADLIVWVHTLEDVWLC